MIEEKAIRRIVDGLYICEYCGKGFKKYGIWNHVLVKHEGGHNNLSNLKIDPWNKGLTKETSKKVRITAEKLKEKYRNGELPHLGSGKKYSEKTLEKMRANCGGCRKGSGRGKSGWYKGYWCDSSWELAFVIYNLEHGIEFKRNTERFEYEFEGKKRKYIPDFILNDGSYVEIKGFLDNKSKVKIETFKGSLKVLLKDSMKDYLNYVVAKYGNDYYMKYDNNSYNKRKVKKDDICKICGMAIHKNINGVCINCYVPKRKVERPSKEELEKMLETMPMTQIGLKYGVSDNAVRKWAKSYILLPLIN